MSGDSSAAPGADVVGYYAYIFSALPSAVSIVVGVVSLLFAAHLLICGNRSFSWLRYAGVKRAQQQQRQKDQRESSRGWLSGGVGGIVAGAASGSILIALLILLILSREATPALGGVAAVIVISLGAVLSGVVGGYSRWFSASVLSILASISITLLLTLSLRLSTLLPRLVILGIFTLFFIVLSFIPRTKRQAMSILSALAGSFYLIVGIDLFTKQGFVDALSLLVTGDGVKMNPVVAGVVLIDGMGAMAKGMIALWWLSAIISSTWQIYWGVENADETWDSYLSQLVSTTPFLSSAGQFFPAKSFLARLFDRSAPGSSTSLTSVPQSFRQSKSRRMRNKVDGSHFDQPQQQQQQHHRSRDEEEGSDWDSDIDTIADVDRRSLAPAKYSRHLADDEDDYSSTKISHQHQYRQQPPHHRHDQDNEYNEETKFGEMEEESDSIIESNRTRSRTPLRSVKDFFQRHSSRPAQYRGKDSDDIPLTARLDRLSQPSTTTKTPSIPPHSVPATTSLILALDRVNAAQREARGMDRRNVIVDRDVDGTDEKWWNLVEEKAEEE